MSSTDRGRYRPGPKDGCFVAKENLDSENLKAKVSCGIRLQCRRSRRTGRIAPPLRKKGRNPRRLRRMPDPDCDRVYRRNKCPGRSLPATILDTDGFKHGTERRRIAAHVRFENGCCAHLHTAGRRACVLRARYRGTECIAQRRLRCQKRSNSQYRYFESPSHFTCPSITLGFITQCDRRHGYVHRKKLRSDHHHR